MTDAVATEIARLNNIEQVQERLGVGRSTVFDLIKFDKLRSVKVGRRRLISEAALVEFIQSLDAGVVDD